MITIGMDPVIVSLGQFSIRWYSLMIAVAIVVGTLVALMETRRRGISDDDLYSFVTWAIIAGIVGARLFHVIDKLDYYLSNPGAMLAFQEGGLAIYGAIVGGLVAAFVFTRYRGIPFGQLADAAAPALILGQALGRIGCMINGDVFGKPADLPWAVAYTHPNSLAPQLGVPAHPAAAYELLWDLVVFGILWKLRTRNLAGGTLLVLYAGLYSIGRFFITFFREDTIVILGLSQAQVISLIGFVLALPFAVFINRMHQIGGQSPNGYGQTSVRS
ncbi:MAG: prolipoprotein diacylglyceryl transferase [Chloroflexi bacterium]|nr:prolipoprotein diacylglyceryl transferase [Chloroflexota bacterium]